MKKHRYFLLLFLLINFVAMAQNPFNFNKDHDAILVKDVNVAAAFYKNILGLEEIYNAGLGEKFRWFKLNNLVQIHLIESAEPIKPHKGVHMAINTDDLNGFMEFLKEKNVPFENWTGEPGTTNTRPDGVRQIYLQDLDGYWIEVNENKL